MQNNKQLWLGVLGATLLLPNAAFADISGKVFHDFNANGTFDVAVESGVVGVTVTATDAAGVSATATTAADGSYSFPNSGATASGSKVRLEFSNLPEFSNNGSAAMGTTVRFVTADAADVNLAIAYADNYCQVNPKVATPLLRSGADNSQVLMFSYKNEGTSALDKTNIADSAQVGSLWGMAYSRSQKLLYAAAVLKTHIPLGDGGLDAIYTIDPATGTPNATPWLQLTDDLGIAVSSVSANPQYADNAARGVDAPPQNDAGAFTDAMKVGIGDIDLSADEKTLYVMNAYDKKVYAIDVATKTLKGSYAIPDPGCSSGQARPWALGEREGKLFAGVTCDGSASGNPASLADESGVGNLKASVYRLDGSTFTSVLSFPLNYPKEPPFQYDDNCKVITKWKPWTDTLPATCSDGNISYPSPVLSDIEFEDNGNMILGFTDRTGFQMGHKNYGPTGITLYSMYTAGDVLKACKDGAGWGIEGTVAGCSSAGGLAINQADPDGYPMSWGDILDKAGEFYEGDFFHNDGNIDGTGLSYFPGHPDIAIGGLSSVPNSGEVMSTAYDPVTGASNYGTGGVITLNNQSGKRTRNGFELYRTTDADPTTAAKGVGLGDLEVLCDPAPIEIGNRVWRDTDEDGIQDADEAGIDGVDVVLTCGANTATAKTIDGGQFLFSSASNAAFMTAGESCKISVASGQVPLDGLSVTTQNADNATENNPLTDVRDSDATTTGEIAFTVGGAGENNHALDIGYKSAPVNTFDPPLGPDAFSCAANVRLATSVQVNGDSQAAGSTGAGVNGLITFDYAATGELAAPFSKATAGQVGSVWGLSYDVSSKKLYAAAFLKRHASFGPDGIGAIYQMDGTSATPTPSLLIDLSANGVDVGTSSRVASSGAVDDPNELPADASQPSWDRDAFAQIGKISIGDIDISVDGKTLWAVNLKQRELVEINLTNTIVTAKHAIPDPGCSNGEFRPWAVKVHDGKVWVGTVCSAETSQQATDLKAYVQAFDGTTFTTATSFPLSYAKGSVGNGSGDEKWQPWTSTYQTLATNPSFAIYPQPILSDIEFDMDGSLILGFMDRMGHQVGSANYTPNYPDTTLVQGQTGGDIIRVCNNGGKYELENNATCTSGSTDGKDKGQGPGNGEYYWGDMWDFNPWNADGGFHQETSFGGLAFKAGSGEIAVTAMNPLNPNANAGGVIWLDNATGGRSANQGVQVYRQQDGTSPYFGKAAGMGDVELFCAEAPPTVHSIGNRVWFDTNNNGTADSGEQHAGDGIKLELKDGTGSTVLQTTATDVNGRYLFHGLAAGSYQVCVTADNFAAGSKLDKYKSSAGFSDANTTTIDGDDSGDDDASNGVCSTVVTLDATEPTSEYGITDQQDGADGQGTPDANSNLTVDFGFVPPTDLKLTKTVDKAAVNRGGTLTYTLTLHNDGPAKATGVQVTDKLPAGVTWVSDDGAGAYDKASGIWTVGEIENGADKVLNITVTVN